MSKFIDIVGRRFGRLVVIELANRDDCGNIKWLCLCDCGNKIVTMGSSLRAKRTKSCGCFQKNKASTIAQGNKYATKHGQEGTRTYKVWARMKQRCCNVKNKRYCDYGARSIMVCRRWKKFENFFEDMGKAPKRLQIDRIDNDKNYCKSNCRWTTAKTNCRNRRNNRLETCLGKTQCISAWAEETGLHKGIIRWRLNNGWSIEKTLVTPTKKYKKKENRWLNSK